MLLEVYKERLEKIRNEQKRLREEEMLLHKAYAETHEWNAYKGRKVRIGESGEWGYLIKVEPCDDVVGCLLMHKIKKDGSEGEREFRVYFNTEKSKIEIEN